MSSITSSKAGSRKQSAASRKQSSPSTPSPTSFEFIKNFLKDESNQSTIVIKETGNSYFVTKAPLAPNRSFVSFTDEAEIFKAPYLLFENSLRINLGFPIDSQMYQNLESIKTIYANYIQNTMGDSDEFGASKFDFDQMVNYINEKFLYVNTSFNNASYSFKLTKWTNITINGKSASFDELNKIFENENARFPVKATYRVNTGFGNSQNKFYLDLVLTKLDITVQ